MLPDRVSNPGLLTYESDALPIALRGPASEYHNILDTELFYREAPLQAYNDGFVIVNDSYKPNLTSP